MLPPQLIQDAYRREVVVTAGEPGQWLVATKSFSYGNFGVNFAESYSLTEGRHRLEASLLDKTAKELAHYETDLVIEASAPELTWSAENAKSVVVARDYVGGIRVSDPQTGIDAVRVGLAEDAMQSIPLKDKQGALNPLAVKFVIEKSRYPEIEAKEKDVRQEQVIFVEVQNGIGKITKLQKKITLVQPAVKMEDNSPKKGNVIVKFGKTSFFDVSYKGPGGEDAIEKVKGMTQFNDLLEGQYTFNWFDHYAKKSAVKKVELKFAKNGETTTITIP